jgi:hypothetical protein
MEAIAKYPNRWPAGTSGNPNGRPPGHHTRHLFSEAFLRELCSSWSKNGPTVLERVAKENPSSYFAVCARLLPSDVSVSIQHQSPALTANDLAVLRAILAAIPNADDLDPQAVLEHTLNAIRSYDAKVIAPDAVTEGSKS